MGNKPEATLRDGAIKATIWANESDKGTFYSVDVVRSYKNAETGEWKDTASFSGSDVLRASNLLAQAYNKTLQLKADANKEA